MLVKMLKRGTANPRFIAAILSLALVVILIVSGPASAYVLSLTTQGDGIVEEGHTILFDVVVTLEEGDELPDSITFNIDGPTDSFCTFDAAGHKISKCHRFNIEKIPRPQIGGYGYNDVDNELVYQIRLHTQKYEAGDYETELVVSAENTEFTQPGESFTVVE